jgi:hypothetical protein
MNNIIVIHGVHKYALKGLKTLTILHHAFLTYLSDKADALKISSFTGKSSGRRWADGSIRFSRRTLD